MASSEIAITNGMPKAGNVTRLSSAESGKERQEMSGGGKVSPQKVGPEVTRETVMEAVSDISDYVQNISRELQFQIDDDIGSTIITVLDRTTGDIIRQIPSEEVVQLARYIAENGSDSSKGLLLDSKGQN